MNIEGRRGGDGKDLSVFRFWRGDRDALRHFEGLKVDFEGIGINRGLSFGFDDCIF